MSTPGQLHTLSTAFVKARQTNTTTNGFTDPVPTFTEPTGKGDAAAQTTFGVFDLVADPQLAADVATAKNKVIIVPFGAGSDTNTFVMRVFGWRLAFDRDKAHTLGTAVWIPVKLAEFTCTLSTPAGPAAGPAGAGILATTDLLCDTIAIVGTSGNTNIDLSITSPADNTIAHVVVDLKGSQKLELQFSTGGSATSCNALVAYE